MNANTRKVEIAVGLFVLTGLLLLGAMIVFFNQAVLFGRDYYVINAAFTNVRGMAPGTPVRHLGITVGEVSSTQFTENRDKVALVLHIWAAHRVPANAHLTIRPSGLLGDYYLEFYGGNMANGTLPINGTAYVDGEPSASLDEMAAKIGDFTGKLGGVLDNLQGNLTSFVQRVNKVLDNDTIRGNFTAIINGLGQTLGDKQFQEDLRAFAQGLHRTLGDEKFQNDLRSAAAEAPETVKSFREVGRRVVEVAQHADELVAKFKGLSDSLDKQVAHQGENMDAVAAALRKDLEAANQTLSSLNEILRNISEGKGTVGALVAKDELNKKLIKALDDLNDALIEIGKMADGIRQRWGK